MRGAIEIFQECGWWSYVAFFAALAALAASVTALGLALARAKVARVFAGIALAIALTPPILGLVGRASGMRNLEAALATAAIEPGDAARIRIQGEKEASGCVTIGLGSGLLPLALAAIALVLAVRPKA